jgi:hypothetical protein
MAADIFGKLFNGGIPPLRLLAYRFQHNLVEVTRQATPELLRVAVCL